MNLSIKTTPLRVRIIFLNVLMLCVQLFYLFQYWNSPVITDNWATIPAILALIAAIINTYSMFRLKIHIYDFRFVFIALSYMFMFGRVWVASLGLEWETSWRVQIHFSEVDMFHTAFYCLCCIQLMFLGMFSLERENNNFFKIIEDSKTNERLHTTGLVLLLIGVPCRLITDANAVIMALTTGYYVSITSLVGLWDDFAFLLIPGVLCILESRPRKRVSILGIVFAYFLVIMSLTGDRRYYVSGILALGMYFVTRMWEKKKPNAFKLVGLATMALFFLNFLQVVRSARNGGLGTFSAFLSNYGAKLFDFSELFVNVFGEFGITFYSVVSIVEYVPSSVMGFQYGMTILRSLPYIIPLGGYIGVNGVVEPSLVINEITGQPVGGSLFGDLYANFGILSLIVVFLLGRVIKCTFRRMKNNNSPMGAVLYFTCIYILINLVRCSICEIVRPIIWCTVLPLLVYNLLSKRKPKFG